MTINAVMFDAFGTLLNIQNGVHPYRQILLKVRQQRRRPKPDDAHTLDDPFIRRCWVPACSISGSRSNHARRDARTHIEHRHSRIRFVTPSERHGWQDHQILALRHELYERERRKRPERWSGQIRNWTLIGTVPLNPDREQQTDKKAA